MPFIYRLFRIPDVQRNRAKSKPPLLRGGRGLDWQLVRGEGPTEQVPGERSVSVSHGGDAIKLQQAGRISCHNCVDSLG